MSRSIAADQRFKQCQHFNTFTWQVKFKTTILSQYGIKYIHCQIHPIVNLVNWWTIPVATLDENGKFWPGSLRKSDGGSQLLIKK